MRMGVASVEPAGSLRPPLECIARARAFTPRGTLEVIPSAGRARSPINVLSVVLAVIVAQAAAPARPRPQEDARLRAMVASMLPKVAQIMREPPTPVPVKIVSRARAEQMIRDGFDRDFPAERLNRLAAALKLIHLIEPGVDLASAMRARAAGADGFYDTTDKTLYLIEGVDDGVQQMVVAHELAHAMQDRLVDLDRAAKARLWSEDAFFALVAAVEGQAQAVADRAMHGGFLDEEAPAPAPDAPAGQARGDPRAHLWRWLSLKFGDPYRSGAALVRALATPGDPVARRVIERLPVSSAQVLSPEAWLKNEQPLSGDIGLARLVDGRDIVGTVLGRAAIDLYGPRLGAGWRGDRLEVSLSDGVLCAAWVVRFATAEQATDFAAAYAPLAGAPACRRARNADRTHSSVCASDTTVVVIEHAPGGLAPAIEAAARGALR
jgi:hypothetical protein